MYDKQMLEKRDDSKNSSFELRRFRLQRKLWESSSLLGEKDVKEKIASFYNEKFGCKTVVVNFEQKSQIHLHSNLT